MKTLKIFEFEELEANAKAAAIEAMKEDVATSPYCITGLDYDIKHTVDEIEKIFDIEIVLDTYKQSYIKYNFDVSPFVGARAIKFLQNKFEFKKLTYNKSKYAAKWALSKNSYVDSWFFGVWSDDAFYIAYEKFCDKLRKNSNYDITDFFDYLLNILDDYWHEAWYPNEEYYTDESCTQNYKFTEDGQIVSYKYWEKLYN